MGEGTTNIQVAVRIRPFLPFEAGSKSCIDVLPGDDHEIHGSNSGGSGALTQGKSVKIKDHSHSHKDSHSFTFDRCFSGLATQVEIYTTLVLPLLKSCLEGYNATTLAYGQTGAGKTYTTLGPATSAAFFAQRPDSNQHNQEHDAVGILPRALRDLFARLEEKRRVVNASHNSNSNVDSNGDSPNPANDEVTPTNSSDDFGIQPTKSPQPKASATSPSNPQQPFSYQVKLQFLELYGEEIRDLLTTSTNPSNAPKIVIRDKAGDAEALGATSIPVNSAQEAMVCLTKGMLRRVTGATAMNAESSRSHAIMSVLVEQVTRSKEEGGQEEAVVVQRSKFNFVDLAGSERQKRTNARGQRLKEGININKGLLVLGNVISALASAESKFVPFRDSKLTRLLRGSLGGNHKTLMIACASPSHKNAEESLNCLRYANRAKNIRNDVSVNLDPHSKVVQLLRGQVVALAGELLRIQKEEGGQIVVDGKRFPVEMLQVLVKGGKEAQGITIGKERAAGSGEAANSSSAAGGAAASNNVESSESSNKTSSSSSANPQELSALQAELERTKAALKESQQDLFDKSEQLEAIVSERDNLVSERDALKSNATTFANGTTPSKVLFHGTPSKAVGMEKRESIREIVTNLDEGDGGSPGEGPEVIVEETEGEVDECREKDLNDTSESVPIATSDKASTSDADNIGTNANDELLQTAQTRIQELSSELQSLRQSLDRSTQALLSKTDDYETALSEVESLKDRLRNTPDIDDETIHYIVKQVTDYSRYGTYDSFDDDYERRSASEYAEDDEASIATSSSSEEEDPTKTEQNEKLSTFATAMFSTGKFLVDREQFADSIPAFETVLEIRRELYGWDDPLVGDALHMEGFVRSKMGDYDRALMLLWDALRIRKIASEPLKISATLRLLADLHFSKEENMHAALFYEECARHLKEHDMRDPHLPLVLIDLARTKDRLGEYPEAMNFFEEALMLYEHALDHDDDRIASLQYEMGVLAFQMGDRERGEGCFRHFIRIRKSKGSNLDEGVANALFVLGSLHWATKKRDLAHDCWVEALEIFQGLGRTEDDPYVKSLKEKIQRAQRRPIGRLFRG